MKTLCLIAAVCLFLLAEAEAAKTSISWTFKPGSDNYVIDQTNIAFRKSVGGFQRTRADLRKKEGEAHFSYFGKYGIITVWLYEGDPIGCGKGVDCAAGIVNAFRDEMKKMHGRYDLEKSFGLQRTGSSRGSGTTYRFLASPEFGRPVYSEVGAVRVGDFLYCYRATFMDKAGLADLAGFLRAFGVKKV